MLSKVINNISNLSVNSLAKKVFKEKGISKFIIDLNREDQLYVEGVDVLGEVVGRYKFLTQQLTQGLSGKGYPKQAGDPFNFYSTGDMYNSFSVKIDNNGFTISADTSDIEDRLNGKQIIGLTDESMAKLTAKIIPLLVEEIKKEIFR